MRRLVRPFAAVALSSSASLVQDVLPSDDQEVFNIEMPDDTVMTVKDRACTPPIWDTR